MLRVEDISAGYGRLQIINGIRLEVPRAGIVALLGGNGTGKSTTLKVICGLLAPSQGKVLLDGERIDGLPAHQIVVRGLSLVPQSKEAFNEMSVGENLLMGAYVHRRRRRQVDEDLERVLSLLPRLRERLRQPAGALSGGERQMLSIGRSLMSRPKIMLLDEPSAALAPRVVAEIADIVRALVKAGTTILLVEQNVGVALSLAAHLYVLRDGRIAFSSKVDANMRFEDLKEYYLGKADSGGS
jgi:branched-chain amino acid transport system ATP-binding protein